MSGAIEKPSAQALSRLHPRRVWNGYLYLLRTSPIMTNCFTAGLIAFSGDAIAQFFEHRQRQDTHTVLEPTMQLNAMRSLSVSSWSFIYSWPNFYWIRFLDTSFGVQRTLYNTMKKVAFNQIVFSPNFISVFFGWISIFRAIDSGRNVTQGMHDWISKVDEDLIYTWKQSCKVWPAAHFVNFLFVPPHFRIIFLNFVALGWSVFMSLVGYKQKPGEIKTAAEVKPLTAIIDNATVPAEIEDQHHPHPQPIPYQHPTISQVYASVTSYLSSAFRSSTPTSSASPPSTSEPTSKSRSS